MSNIEITIFEESNIVNLVDVFAKANWPKPVSLFKQYLEEQKAGERRVWLAYLDKQIAGYCTLSFKSKYKPFADSNIPEIMDLNVLPKFRNLGVGSALLDIAEASVTQGLVGIGVGLYEDYGNAQKLYIKRGYIPDGKGVSYNYEIVAPGNNYPVDDDLVLWLIKNIKI